MKKYLITGFSGFVSAHFLNYLESLNEPVTVLGVDVNEPQIFSNYKFVDCGFKKLNLLDKKAVGEMLLKFKPDFILHLASYSSVAYSWKHPVDAFVNNSNIFLNLVDQVRLLELKCRILSVGSSEEYGKIRDDEIPITEQTRINPQSPYAVARVSQEMLSEIYANHYKVDIVLTRSFNHIGPGQKDIFVISSFAKQLVEIKKFNRIPEIVTGNLSIIRDFLDVRDVVQAYYALFQHGRKGEVYNICSSQGVSLDTVISQMAKLLNLEIKTITDQSLIRPNDNTIIVGSNKKIVSETGWNTTYSLEQSLIDILEYWDKKK